LKKNESKKRGLSVSLALALLVTLGIPATAQVNSGSDGSDGALNPTKDLVIDMADHPDGIYHYTSVNIPVGVMVSFTPNAANTPVVWLVQEDCIIEGTVNVAGSDGVHVYGGNGAAGGLGGPGGWKGGSANYSASESGQGPGGGTGINGTIATSGRAGGGSFSTAGSGTGPGPTYGNVFLLPLIGGSGGGGIAGYAGSAGGMQAFAGGGGGGALLIAASGLMRVDGSINAKGGAADFWGGAGSGGAVRVVANQLVGTGSIAADSGCPNDVYSGRGRVRIDAFEFTSFAGSLSGSVTRGFQPIIIPAPGQGIQLSVQSVGGVAVPANPSGVLVNPDVIVPAQQTNPVQVVVQCTNVPLNSEITVVVHPANGTDVQAVGLNNVGTTASSTATVSVNMPRGGGILFAKAVTGINSNSFASVSGEASAPSIAQTGWVALPITLNLHLGSFVHR